MTFYEKYIEYPLIGLLTLLKATCGGMLFALFILGPAALAIEFSIWFVLIYLFHFYLICDIVGHGE